MIIGLLQRQERDYDIIKGLHGYSLVILDKMRVSKQVLNHVRSKGRMTCYYAIIRKPAFFCVNKEA